jgi:hypothetical protein
VTYEGRCAYCNRPVRTGSHLTRPPLLPDDDTAVGVLAQAIQWARNERPMWTGPDDLAAAIIAALRSEGRGRSAPETAARVSAPAEGPPRER